MAMFDMVTRMKPSVIPVMAEERTGRSRTIARPTVGKATRAKEPNLRMIDTGERFVCFFDIIIIIFLIYATIRVVNSFLFFSFLMVDYANLLRVDGFLWWMLLIWW